jgi:hypothetical protein
MTYLRYPARRVPNIVRELSTLERILAHGIEILSIPCRGVEKLFELDPIPVDGERNVLSDLHEIARFVREERDLFGFLPGREVD